MRVLQNEDYLFIGERRGGEGRGGEGDVSCTKNYSILGSIFGCPYVGKLHGATMC